MKITYNWLSSFIDLQIDANELADNLSMIGLEVEEVIDNSKLYANFIIAEIKSVKKHPDAGKLSVCEVYDGQKILQIVCGANNVAEGLKVVLAPVGTKMPLDGMKIKATKIRGVESLGMICAASELFENAAESEGIIEISDDNAEIGMLYADLIGIKDQIIDINITPNRGDALSIYGVARDLYAKDLGKLKDKYIQFQELDLAELSEAAIGAEIIDKKHCQDIAFMKISGLNNNGAINREILAYFNSLAIKTHTPLVTISNFAMYELGRPNHTYDADKIKGKIVVRPSVEGEKFVSLEHEEYQLPAGIMVVADAEKVLAVAGVMGGEESKVDEHTQNIIVEVANFCPIQVLKSMKALNLRTESSYRFERRVDFGNTRQYMAYIADLITRQCGGKIEAVKFLQGEPKQYAQEVAVDFSQVSKLYGAEINQKTAQEALAKLGFEFNTASKTYAIPTWRQGDVEDQGDLTEEIIRMVDFQEVGEEISLQMLPAQEITDLARDSLINRGFFEQITWSFVKHYEARLFSDPQEHIVLKNPISQDFVVMRPSLIPGLISVVQKNMARSVNSLALMEVGKAYNKQAEKHIETNMVVAVKVGAAVEKGVHQAKRECDFFDIKDDLMAIFNEFQIAEEKLRFVPNASAYYHPGKSAAVYLGKQLLAYVGAIHPQILQNLDCSLAIYALELFTENLPPRNFEKKKVVHLSDLQKIKRDFAFLVDQSITCADLHKAVRSLNIDLIEKLEVFDNFQSKELQSKKSMAFSVHIQPKQQTLTEIEIKDISDRIISKIESDCHGELRC
jgi:phenylalanyl-tRNA synthetase beta chain